MGSTKGRLWICRASAWNAKSPRPTNPQPRRRRTQKYSSPLIVRLLPCQTERCFNQVLRRLLPILLLAAFLLPMFAPLLAFGQSSESQLPACCRRMGKHHCAMTMAEKSQSAMNTAPWWTAPVDRCPYCPASVAPGHFDETLASAPAQAIYAEMVSHPSGVAQTESKRRIAQDRSRQKRGPPSLLS